MSENDLFRIDIRQVLKNKAPKTWVPGFVINYLKKIAHEDDLNKLLQATAGKKNLDFIDGALDYLNIRMDIVGKENLPPKGKKYIFAGNHPLGGLDGVATGLFIGREYDGKVRFFANDILMNLEPLSEMFIPINKVGSQNKNYAASLREAYESDDQLITYPAGMCSRKQKGAICDMEWKKNFIVKSIEYQRDVVPVYFEGRNSNFFYNLANIRKRLHIKFNIEMMYLVDELFKKQNSHFKIHVGKTIPWQTFDKSKTQTEWAAWVKDIVYKMAEK